MNDHPFIPVSAPALAGNERAYVMDCLDTSWISSGGPYVRRFEEAFAAFCGAEHALTCCNGTVALHLALLGLGIGPGDEVIVPTLTFVATANAVTYCGATPVFIDAEPGTWNLDATRLEALVTPRTRAIIAVHLYGHPVDMDPVLEVARVYDLAVVEDAAEAHGAAYGGRRVGTLGDVATFSFYGNKILTTGEGGMVVTDDAALAARVARLKGQGMDPRRRYWFPEIGYNYRMTNVAAAIGLAQVEQAAWHLDRRRTVAGWYRARLARAPGLMLQAERPWADHAHWIVSVVLDGADAAARDRVMARLHACGIETRPFFYPLHTLPMYRRRGERLPVAEDVAARGIMLPTAAGLTEDDVAYVCAHLCRIVAEEALSDFAIA